MTDQLTQIDPDERRPDYLIIGLEKAGTSWLTRMLSEHPEVSVCRPEVHFFTNIISGMRKKPEEFQAQLRRIYSQQVRDYFQDLESAVGTTDRKTLERRFLRRYNAFVQQFKSDDTRIVGEKTPKYVYCLRRIDRHCPGIKKICILRDHRDRLVSWHHHLRRYGREEELAITDAEVKRYCNQMEREYNRMAAYEGSLFPLTYEQLSTNPRPVTKNMLAYLGVDTDPEIVDRVIEQSDFEAVTGRPRGVTDEGRHRRKGVVGDGTVELSIAQQQQVVERLGNVTRQVGEKFGLDLSDYLKVA
ncbi:MAG: sulfotransferase [Dehalococcoidia bacterium]